MSITRLTTIIAATAVIFASVVSPQAPPPAPFPSTAGPMAPAPFSFGPSAPGPAASNDCVTALFNMSDCLTYVENVSTLTVPDKKCCPELAGLVESNPICLCQLLGNSSMTESFGITIDVARALKLPSACGLKTPPITLCTLAGYPVPGPISSAGSPPVAGPTSGVMSAPSGSLPADGSPSTSTPGNNALAMAGCSQAFFLGLAFAFLLTFC